MEHVSECAHSDAFESSWGYCSSVAWGMEDMCSGATEERWVDGDVMVEEVGAKDDASVAVARRQTNAEVVRGLIVCWMG